MGAEQQKNPKGTIIIGPYKLIKRDHIGRGAYSTIYLCSDAQSGNNYALKETNLRHPQAQQMYNKEIQLMKKMNQLKFEGCVKMLMSEVQTQHRQKVGRILMEFGPITLFDEINHYDYKDEQIYAILRDVSKGLAELHSINVTHLDLKPENIVLVGKTYKICDFGSALAEPIQYDELSEVEQEEFVEYLTNNTTLIYSAPEMVEPRTQLIGPAVDMWQLGCTAYVMTFGQPPFKANKADIVGCKLEYPEGRQELKEIIKRLLEFDPQKRLTAQELVKILNQKLKKQ